MFEINKKGSDKGPDTTPQRAEPGNTVRADSGAAPRRPEGSREAAVIGPSIHIDGDLRGEEDLLIEGEVNGPAIVADRVAPGVGTLTARAALDRFVATLAACGCG